MKYKVGDKVTVKTDLVWERKEVMEITLEEIAEIFGVPLEQLRIKDQNEKPC